MQLSNHPWTHKIYTAGLGARSQVLDQWRGLQSAADSPESVARAFAVGTVVSFLPIPAVGMLLATLLSAQFKLNKAAILMALAIWNDFVLIPIYALGLRLGTTMGAVLLHLPAEPTRLQQTAQISLNLLAGNLALALALTAVSYLGVYTGLKLAQTPPSAFKLRCRLADRNAHSGAR